MQFETRIVDGKPSIFYKDDSSKGSQYSSRKAPGKNTGRRSMRGSVAISGELDYVQPSPRQFDPPTASPERMTQAQINALNKKLGVKLNKKQLVSIMNTIQDSDRPKTNATNRNGRFQNNENLNNNNNYDDEIRRQKYSAQYNQSNYEDDIKIYKPAQVVVVQEEDEQVSNNIALNDDVTSRPSLVDKKKMKWQQEKDVMDKMLQQERYDISKGVSSPKPLEKPQGGGMSFFNGGSISNRSNLISKIENPTDPSNLKHKSTMTLAEKKRIQWQKERENTEAIKHKSTHDLTRVQQETTSYRNQDDNLIKSNSLNSLIDNLELSNRKLDSQPSQQPQRISLTDKKRLKWEQDFEENYNPYGKPGCGAGPSKKNNTESEVPQVVSHLPPTKDKNPNTPNTKNPKGHKYKESLEEYKKINDTLAQIIAAENKIKQDQIEILRAQVNQQRQEVQQVASIQQPSLDHNQSAMSNEQKMVPAAMRTSIMFGNVAHEDEIRRTKELERKKWLLELEAQKKEKMIDQQKQKVEADNFEQKKQNELRQSWNSPRVNNTEINQNNNQFMNDDSNVPAAMRTSINFNGNQGGNQQNSNAQDNDQVFGRTRNLLDPAQLDELERKRNKNLQHKLEIEAQIAEKKRIKDLENQVQNLNNLKIENEAKQMNSQNQAYQEQKAKQPQYHNFEKILTTNADDNNNQVKKNVTMASILQGDTKKGDNNEPQSTRNSNDAKTTDSHVRLQMAELAAAEEKHKRLLKRLQKGGHDTRNLENKFNEYKSKILMATNPELNINNNVVNNSNVNNLDSNNRNFTSMSNHVVAELEQQKKTLEKELRISNENINEKENDSSQISDQKMQQIFKMLREDTMGLPAELTEDQLKAILQKVSQKQQTDQPKTQQKAGKGAVNRTKSNSADNRNSKKVVTTGSVKKPGGKPMWNATKTTKVKMSNSEKDPFYAERKAIADERKQKRLEQHQNMVEKNNKKYQEFLKKKDEETQKITNRSSNQNQQHSEFTNRSSNHQQNNEFTDRLINQRQSVHSDSTMSNYQNYEDTKRGTKPQNESIMNLLTKNLANKKSIIYEDDEDRYLKPAPNSHRQLQNLKEPPKQAYTEPPQSQRFLSNDNDMRLEDIGSPLGFVPFMRTDEFLNPAHAASPIPPSREASAVKNEREKARNAYYKNQNPADYGSNYYNNGLDSIQESNRNRIKDPLLNNGLVKNNPTPRQEQILSQLATLKQSLMQKQRDVANSIQIDTNNGYDSDA